MPRRTGFSLTELLVALSILGILAAFGIPSILNSQGDKADRARYKETLAAVQGAFAGYKASGKANANTRFSDFTSYLKYSEVITNQPSYIDGAYADSTPTNACDDWTPCLRMHNGAILYYDYGDGTLVNTHRFGGTTSKHFIFFRIDPDGKITNPSNFTGSGRSVNGLLYYNGNIGLLSFCRAGDSTYYFGTDVSGTMWCNEAWHNINDVPPYAR